jgi:hypothetical protein
MLSMYSVRVLSVILLIVTIRSLQIPLNIPLKSGSNAVQFPKYAKIRCRRPK